MKANNARPGAARLAQVLDERMGLRQPGQAAADIGDVQADGALVLDLFPVPIPSEEYLALDHVGVLKSGDRVAVIWVGDEAVVVGKIS